MDQYIIAAATAEQAAAVLLSTAAVLIHVLVIPEAAVQQAMFQTPLTRQS